LKTADLEAFRFVEVKERYPDTLLMVEVGYRVNSQPDSITLTLSLS
jgi:hypothetical protein